MRRIQTQTLLPPVEPAAMLCRALLAAGQSTPRRADARRAIGQPIAGRAARLAASTDPATSPQAPSAGLPHLRKTAHCPAV